ncbi:hypothetical protein CEXT_499101 [Caerostris extrusa]|uniref:Maturase K n=1 Tax=Caerostris extrusa TaxID=172846 RepID=A0AAV4W249_CAEEX|nr:hypothetical protein CEXT_499101 [Caerostris extrusa]
MISYHGGRYCIRMELMHRTKLYRGFCLPIKGLTSCEGVLNPHNMNLWSLNPTEDKFVSSLIYAIQRSRAYSHLSSRVRDYLDRSVLTDWQRLTSSGAIKIPLPSPVFLSMGMHEVPGIRYIEHWSSISSIGSLKR